MNLLQLMDSNKEKLNTVEFTKSTLLITLITQVQPNLDTIGTVLYPKGTPQDSVNIIKTICSVANVNVEESVMLGDYVKQTGVKPDEQAFWATRGFDPDNDDLAELAGLYNSILDCKKQISEITGIKTKHMVWYIRTQAKQVDA